MFGEENHDIDLLLREHTICKKKEVTYKGSKAKIIGFHEGKVLLEQNNKKIATDPKKVGLYL